MTPPDAGTRSRLLDAAALARTVRRLAHEVRERHPGLRGVLLAAVCEGGVPLARRLSDHLAALGEPRVPLVALDVRDYRDDRPRPARPAAGALGPVPGCPAPGGPGPEPGPPSVAGATVVLVDDVIHTGRTLRAALDLLADHGRPAAVEPLVLVDRGHRELPLRATYVGRNLPVAPDAWVDVVWEAADAGAWLVQGGCRGESPRRLGASAPEQGGCRGESPRRLGASAPETTPGAQPA